MGIASPLSLSLACLALATAPAAYQGYRLNGPLAPLPLGAAEAAELSPSGTQVAFLADVSATIYRRGLFLAPVDGSRTAIELVPQDASVLLADQRFTADESRVVYRGSVDGAMRLWAVRLDGSLSAEQLSGTMVSGGQVSDFLPSPIGNRIVFRATKDTLAHVELYSVPADLSSPPAKLNGPLVAHGHVEEYRITPDGSRVIYRADQTMDGVFDLWSAPIDGSAPAVRLNLSRPLRNVQSDFQLSFDSLGVVYRADQDTDEVFELYAARVDGSGTPVKRSGTLVAGGDVVQFALSGSNDRLTYRADQAANDVFELWSVLAVTGGTPVKLNGPLEEGNDVQDMALSPDGTRVVYSADVEDLAYDELFGVPADGSAPAVQLSQIVENRFLSTFTIPGSAGRVLFAKDTSFGSDPLLFSAPIDGSQPATLLGVGLFQVEGVLPDGTVLALGRSRFGITELFAVPIDGGTAPERLSGPMVSGGMVFDAKPSESTARVVYLAAQTHSLAPELFSVPVTGGIARRLSPPFPLGQQSGSVRSFEVAPDGTHAVYGAHEGSSNVLDLHGVATDGSGGSLRLNVSTGTAGVGEFAISPDGARVLYRLDTSSTNTIELHSAPLDAHGSSVRLDVDGPQAGDGFRHAVEQAMFTPDSAQVVYLADHANSVNRELFLVPSDGSASPVALHPGATPGNDQQFTLSPNGAWAVYRRFESALGELFRVPLDGHLPAERLHAAYVGSQNIGGDQFNYFVPWTITPDSTRVVYLADEDAANVTELYSVPIDGSQAPVKLNAPFTLLSDIDMLGGVNGPPFQVSPDSTQVLYRADQEVEERFELYRVAIGGGPVVKLNGPLVSGGGVGHFAIDPSSTRAVYVANEQLFSRKELWSVPLDGSAPRVKISGGTTGNVSVGSSGRPFLLAASGRVVYLADNDVSFRFELWSAPLDGSSAPLLLNAPLAASGDVFDFQLSADGTRVVYTADQLQAGVIELFVVPVDGSAGPRRVSGPMVAGGGVQLEPGSFRVTVNDLVLYLADQDAVGRIELYASALDWRRGPALPSTGTTKSSITPAWSWSA
ncbi:MAG: LpqB family beta-propeller domain-containing protein, partial [Planctomycetota bacterium]